MLNDMLVNLIFALQMKFVYLVLNSARSSSKLLIMSNKKVIDIFNFKKLKQLKTCNIIDDDSISINNTTSTTIAVSLLHRE